MTSADQAQRLRQLAASKKVEGDVLPSSSEASCRQLSSSVCVEVNGIDSTVTYDGSVDAVGVVDETYRTAPGREVKTHLNSGGNEQARDHSSSRSEITRSFTRRKTTYITITSGKGGVGKTNVAVNLAVAIAQTGQRVTLIDADLGTANADVICGITSAHNLSHVLHGRRRTLNDVAVDAPGGFRLVPGANGIRRFADLSQGDQASLIRELSALERVSDVIIIDTGAGIGSGVTAMTAMADLVLVVVTPEPTSLTDGYGLIKAIHSGSTSGSTSHQRLAVLVNMVSSRRQARAVYDRIATVSRRFLGIHIDMAGSIPIDPHVSKSVLKRSPFILNCPHAPASTSLIQLSDRLLRSVSHHQDYRSEDHLTEHAAISEPVREVSGYFTRFRRWLGAGSAG